MIPALPRLSYERDPFEKNATNIARPPCLTARVLKIPALLCAHDIGTKAQDYHVMDAVQALNTWNMSILDTTFTAGLFANQV